MNWKIDNDENDNLLKTKLIFFLFMKMETFH